MLIEFMQLLKKTLLICRADNVTNPHPIHSLIFSDKQLSSLKVGIKAVLNDDRFKDKYQDVEYISMLIRHIEFKDVMG